MIVVNWVELTVAPKGFHFLPKLLSITNVQRGLTINVCFNGFFFFCMRNLPAFFPLDVIIVAQLQYNHRRNTITKRLMFNPHKKKIKKNNTNNNKNTIFLPV